MGLSVAHALGRNRKFFVTTEATPGTFVKPAAADAAKILKAQFSPEYSMINRMDSRATRSLLERMQGKAKVGWSVEAEVVPSGTAGTPPDLHLLYKAALPGYTNTPNTSDEYKSSDSQTFPTVSMTQHFNDVLMETIWGAWVDSMTLSIKGGETAKVKFEGGAMGYATTGSSTLNGNMVASATMVVATADARNFSNNSVVKIGSADNSGAGYKVTADTSRPSFTIEATASGSSADPVIPFTPAETTAGTPLVGIAGTFTIDSVAVPIVTFEMSTKNNIKAVEDEALTQFATDVIPGHFEWTGNIGIRARKDLILELGKRVAYGNRDIAAVLGTAAGKRLAIDIDRANFDFAPVEAPESDECMISLPFVAIGSSGTDEGSLKFY
jgi:hypothetical protein